MPLMVLLQSRRLHNTVTNRGLEAGMTSMTVEDSVWCLVRCQITVVAAVLGFEVDALSTGRKYFFMF